MKDTANYFDTMFRQERLDELFPMDRADQFFDALLGDADEGAYDIRLTFKSYQNSELRFELKLKQRPGKCLACNLTYGLPQVFARHPIIDIDGVVSQIDKLIAGHATCKEWKLEATREIGRDLHVVPLIITIDQ